MPELALKIIDRLRAVCAKVDGAPAYPSRLDTLELHAQLRLSETDADGAWTAERLLASTMANARSVLDAGDETLPSAIMLRQLIDRAELEGGEVPPDAQEMLDRLYEGLAPPLRALVDAAGRQADAASIAAIAGSIGPARYNDDVSYDLRVVRSMATRLARSSIERVDLAGFAYAVELQGVQGVGVHGDGPEVTPAARLLAKPADPLAAALEIAKLGIPIVGLAIDELGLMTMTVDEHGAGMPVAVDTAIFDPARLREWSRSFPYGYADEELDEDGFRASTAGIRLPELPGRSIVLSGGLASVPPNVMTIDWNLAGLRRDRTLLRAMIAQVRMLDDAVEIDLASCEVARQLQLSAVPDAPAVTTLRASVRLTRTGRAVRLVTGDGGTLSHKADASLISLIIKARRWWDVLRAGEIDVTMLAQQEQVSASYVTRVLRLAFLAPAVIDAALAGKLRAGIDIAALTATGAIDPSWAAQRRIFLPG